MSSMPLAIFGSINPLEILVVGVAALLIFGPRLPEVTLRLVAHVMRARRAVTKMWRETGLEDELRRVRRDIELSIPRDADFDIQSPVRKALTRTADTSSTSSGTEGDEDPDGKDPDADRAEEPFDSSVTIEPADDIIASGEWDPAIDSGSDSEADRREPDADPDTYADPAAEVQVTDLAPDEDEAPGEAPGEASDPDVDAPKTTD